MPVELPNELPLLLRGPRQLLVEDVAGLVLGHFVDVLPPRRHDGVLERVGDGAALAAIVLQGRGVARVVVAVVGALQLAGRRPGGVFSSVLHVADVRYYRDGVDVRLDPGYGRRHVRPLIALSLSGRSDAQTTRYTKST